jgi:hypothetical protein
MPISVGVNPATTGFNVNGIRVLDNSEELEREVQRIGGRF